MMVAGAGHAFAQGAAAPGATTSNDNGQLGELVVTAQKRAENVQDVPISVTVVSGQQIERQHVTELTDLAKTSTALEFGAPAAAPGGGAILRGIGTNFAFSGTAEAAVGIVVDGVPQGNVNSSNIFDVARVEVLKGPQGMLFGQSTSAGVINMTTNAPSTNGISGRLSAEISPDNFLGSQIDRFVYQGVVNVPLSSNAAIRVTAHDDLLKGIQSNAFTDTRDRSEDLGGRARVLWTPNDDLTFNLIVDYDENRLTNGDFITYASVPAGSYLANLLAACGITPSLSNGTSCAGTPAHAITKNLGISGQFDWKVLGDHTFTSITSYRHVDFNQVNDVDTFPTVALGGVAAEPVQLGGLLSAPNIQHNYLATQEFRLASPSGNKLEYTAGFFFSDYYSHDLEQGDTTITTPFFSQNSPAVSIRETRSTTEALFGQGTYHLTDKWRLLAGGRVTNQSISGPTSFKQVSNPSYNPALYPQTPYTYTGKETLQNFSWRVGTQYDVVAGAMAYLTVTRGFKGPQIDTTDNTRAPVFVAPEIPLDVEVGLKTSVFDRRLYIDIDYFYDTVQNFQAESCRVSGAGATAVNVCAETNLPHVVTQGAELELFGRPFHGLSVNGGLSYNPVKYPNGYLAPDPSDATGKRTVNLGGYQLAYAPLIKANVGGEYTHDLSFAASTEGFISLNGTYKSDDRLYVTTDPRVVYPAHWLVDGRIGVRFDGGKFQLSVFGKNLFDQREAGTLYPSVLAANIDNNFGFPGSPYYVSGHPSSPSYMTYLTPVSYRTIGIALDARF
jgi:iron complex outermembrane receptor protein